MSTELTLLDSGFIALQTKSEHRLPLITADMLAQKSWMTVIRKACAEANANDPDYKGKSKKELVNSVKTELFPFLQQMHAAKKESIRETHELVNVSESPTGRITETWAPRKESAEKKAERLLNSQLDRIRRQQNEHMVRILLDLGHDYDAIARSTDLTVDMVRDIAESIIDVN